MKQQILDMRCVTIGRFCLFAPKRNPLRSVESRENFLQVARI